MECVTVLLATYNQREYIYEAINSVICQTYGNIQLIIADDGSKYFQTAEVERYVCDKNKGNITRCTVLKNEVNLGTVKNLNKARKYIKGKYVIPLSGDDCFYNETVIEKYVMEMEKRDGIQVLVSQVVQFDKTMTKPLYKCVTDQQIKVLSSGNNNRIYAHVCLDCFIPAIGCCYDAKILEDFGDYDEDCILVEDWPTYLKMLRMGVKFCFVDFISAKHRDGGVSYIKKSKVEEHSDIYHKDLMTIIKKEILPNYQFAEKKCRRKVFNYANDRSVISEYRSTFKDKSIIGKVKWIWSNKNILFIFVRGCIRKIKFLGEH